METIKMTPCTRVEKTAHVDFIFDVFPHLARDFSFWKTNFYIGTFWKWKKVFKDQSRTIKNVSWTHGTKWSWSIIFLVLTNLGSGHQCHIVSATRRKMFEKEFTAPSSFNKSSLKNLFLDSLIWMDRLSSDLNNSKMNEQLQIERWATAT